jgi:hypothetical protein
MRDQLSAIADLKVRQIVGRRWERIGDAVAVAGNPALAGRTGGNGRALRAWLESFREFYGYQEIAVLQYGIRQFPLAATSMSLDKISH